MDFKYSVVDSSVFVAFYNQADTQHDLALKIMEELEPSGIIVHPYVVQEVATVLTYRFGLEIGKKFLSDINSANNIEFAPADLKAEMESFSSIETKISFTDIAIINLAQKMAANLITFDKQMLSILKKTKLN